MAAPIIPVIVGGAIVVAQTALGAAAFEFVNRLWGSISKYPDLMTAAMDTVFSSRRKHIEVVSKALNLRGSTRSFDLTVFLDRELRNSNSLPQAAIEALGAVPREDPRALAAWIQIWQTEIPDDIVRRAITLADL